MKSQHSHHNDIIIDKNTDIKIDSNSTYNYKKRRDALNAVVKNYIDRQKQNLAQKNNLLLSKNT